jgi:ribonuclease R
LTIQPRRRFDPADPLAKQLGKQSKPRGLPSKPELLAFIEARSGKVGKREIARAFGISGHDRIDLKNMLRELAEEGHLERKRKKLHRSGKLPSVVLADIVARDSDGELIAVPTEWDEEAHGSPPKIRIHVPRRSRPGEIAGIGDRALLRTEEVEDSGDEIRHQGRVIKVIDRAKHRVLGIFRALPGGGGRLAPVEKKQLGKELAIPAGATADAQDGDLVAAEVTRSAGYGLQTARIRERLGSLKTERAVSMIAIHAHGIPNVFPRAALAEAEAAVAADLSGREDWRQVPFVTIDPADAKDHDDAVHAVADSDPKNPGGHVVSVAIADVAHYVQPASALDREALLRGNSVYFPDRVVPMLPERISNDLCSLKAGVDRAAIAVRMVIGADGRKRSHAFHRVLIRSAARLHYTQVQDAIDGAADEAIEPLLPIAIEPLYAAYSAVKRARDDRAPLELDLPERKMLLKPDGTVDRVVTPPRRESHRLIEEFMILANVAAAETLERARVAFIYRVHDEPALEKIQALREFLRTLDISLQKSQALRPADFNRILARVEGSDVEKLVHEVVLRSQSQAEYAAENYGHFGLNLRRYAHFTSPIRRYADLIVHRALIRALKLGRDGLPEGEDVRSLGEIGAKISATERRAMVAERETVDRLIAHFLAEKIGAMFDGHVSGVTRAGLFVKLDDTGADGFIPARTLGSDYFRYREAEHALVGETTGETHRLGDRVKVRLVEAIPVAGALRFELLSEGRPSARGGRRDRGAGQRTSRGEIRRPKQRASGRKGR